MSTTNTTPVDFVDDEPTFDGSSYSTSLVSKAYEYEEVWGRCYHSYHSGKYLLPNDEKEQSRLNLLHSIFLLVLNQKLHYAPMHVMPQRVLDVGTGTGIWAIEFGDKNELSEITAIDLSPIQSNWTPPNVRFYVDDAEDDWIDEDFDYIHGRGLNGCFERWDVWLNAAFTHLRPGGWLEFQDFGFPIQSEDGPITEMPYLGTWQNMCCSGATKFQREILVPGSLKDHMKNVGFKDVCEKKVNVPIGPWPEDSKGKEMGVLQHKLLIESIEPYTYGYCGKVHNWSKDECDVLIAKVRSELRDCTQKLYTQYIFTFGQKSKM